MSITREPSGRYLARFRDAEHRQYKRRFDRKIDATNWLAEQRAAVNRGTFIDSMAGRQTFRDYAEAWRLAQAHRPSTRAVVETHLRRHAYPALGHRPLSAVRPSEIQTWVTGLPVEPSTARLIYTYVSQVFRAAVRDRVIASSPCDRIRLPKVEREQVRPLTPEQVRGVVDETPERWQALVVLAAGTGLRQGEALGLTVDRLDMLRKTLRVDRQLITLPGSPHVLAPPKTTASVRTVRLPQVVVDALAAHLAAFPAGPDGFVFTTERGHPVSRTWYSAKVWRPAVDRAGVTATFHALRHHYASLLIRHGESVVVVQEPLGHASATETMQTYAHLWPDAAERSVEAIDLVLGDALSAETHSSTPARR